MPLSVLTGEKVLDYKPGVNRTKWSKIQGQLFINEITSEFQTLFKKNIFEFLLQHWRNDDYTDEN